MFYDIVFDLIKIIRSLKASQNDCQILIFVKAIYVVGEKMTRNSGKIVKFQSCPIRFRSEFSLVSKETKGTARQMTDLVEVRDSFKTLGSIISFLMICFEVTIIVTSKQIIQKRKISPIHIPIPSNIQLLRQG